MAEIQVCGSVTKRGIPDWAFDYLIFKDNGRYIHADGSMKEFIPTIPGFRMRLDEVFDIATGELIDTDALKHMHYVGMAIREKYLTQGYDVRETYIDWIH